MLNWLRKFFLSDSKAGRSSMPSVQGALDGQTQKETEALRDKGHALMDEGRLDEAAVCYRQVLAINSDDSEVLVRLGFVLCQLRLFTESEQVLRRAISINPRDHDAFYWLGNLFELRGALDIAVSHYKKAIELKPDFAFCRRDLCRALFHAGKIPSAKALISEGILINPDFADFHYYLGNLLFYENAFNEAIASYERALSILPDYAEVHNNLGKTFCELGRVEAAADSFQKAWLLKTDSDFAFSAFLSMMNYHPDKEATEIFSAYREFDLRFGVPLRNTWKEYGNNRNSGRKIKVGYVSPDFRHHSVRHFLEPLLANHDKEQIEVFAYAELASEDEQTLRYKKYVDHWVPTRGVTSELLAERIRKDEIDILVDTAGHTSDNRLDLFAAKPAPISLTWLGYGYTTGLSAIDYFLTDEIIVPQGSEGLFSEKPWRLKQTALVYRPDKVAMGPVSRLPALERGYVTFGTLTRAIRINHKTIRVWAEILRRVSGSRLVVDSRNFRDASVQAHLTERFAEQGIGRDRLEIGCHSPPWDVLRGIDISLDCFPHNSGTTLFETLYMGVPYITLVGRPSVGRLGSSILEGAGHPEWIALSEEEYVEKTVRLASDLVKLAEIRVNLRPDMEASYLMDEVCFARKIESAYRKMFEKWCESPTLTGQSHEFYTRPSN